MLIPCLRQTLLFIWAAFLFCFAAWSQTPGAALEDVQRQAYIRAYEQGRNEEKALPFHLESACNESEFLAVAIGLMPLPDAEGIPVRIAEFSFDEFFGTHRAGRMSSFIIGSDEAWTAAAAVLVRHADALTDAAQSAWITKEGHVPFEIRLIFHFPRKRLLEVAGLDYVLSEKAQKYLSVTSVSDYPARRKVLIIQEPHNELDRQFNLFKGLECLFEDNPRMLMENRTTFLAEGLPQGEELPMAPLVQADPRPGDRLIRDVLSTFLIPGYVAYEWKHQTGIPIVGSEDQRLHRISAQIWTDLQKNRVGTKANLWPYTVAARNQTITASLLQALKKYENAILFVGGRHLQGLADSEMLRPSDWQVLGELLSDGEARYLHGADAVGIVELLKSRGVGFYFISANGNPFPNGKENQSQFSDYVALFQKQLSFDSVPPFRRQGRRADSVTVTPSTKEAAKATEAKKSNPSTGQNGSGGEDSGSGSGSGSSSNGGSLNNLLSGIKDSVSKATSRFWQSLKGFRGKTKTNGLSGKDRRFFEWDHTHNDIEVYDNKGKHLGSADPNTGEITKPAVPGRRIDI